MHSPLAVGDVAEVNEVAGSEGEGRFEGLPVVQVSFDGGEPHTVEWLQPGDNFCQFLADGLCRGLFPELRLNLSLGLL